MSTLRTSLGSIRATVTDATGGTLIHYTRVEPTDREGLIEVLRAHLRELEGEAANTGAPPLHTHERSLVEVIK